MTTARGTAIARARIPAILLAILCALAAPCPAGQNGAEVKIGPERLPELKAAVVVRILNFVEWRGDRDAEAGDPLRLGVLACEGAREAFAAHAGTQVNGRPLEIVDVAEPDEIAACQILYVCGRRGEDDPAPDIDLRRLPGILTIGDAEDFNESGGIIQLSLERGKLVFSINTRHLDDEDLFLSSRLLRVARIHQDD